MTEDKYSVWKDAITRTARFTARDFPDVEVEDISQHLWLKIFSQKHFKDPDAAGASKMLARWAKAFAWDQRKEHLTLSAQYNYRASDVREILQTVFSQEDWVNVRIPDDARSEYNDVFLEINCDVKVAWERLGHAQKKVIFERYALGLDMITDADRKRFYRAIDQLVENLNWYKKRQDNRECVGSRRAISNANARFDISKLNDEE